MAPFAAEEPRQKDDKRLSHGNLISSLWSKTSNSGLPTS